MRVSICELSCRRLSTAHGFFFWEGLISLLNSTVKDSSVVAVQIFDQRKFKRRDQGFLGVVNVRVSDVLDLDLDGHGAFSNLL
jgi:hypothetical protein